MKKITALVTVLSLASCAYPNMPTPPSQITPIHVSSVKYEHLDCQRLLAEFDSVSRREAQVTKAQEQRMKSSEQQAMWWGYGQGDGIEASELATLRGEKEALRRTLDIKNCGI